MSKFTKEDGLAVQRDNLADWKLKLNSKTYSLLFQECERQNELLNTDNGHRVFRGSDLTIFIQNLYR